ncbi:16S rRNA (guanine(966)-N(2))-methyltransferase RsmD [Aestuariibacter salexigens]|uniref:16S rRNA (guanine(966)-N(2))-methyltransferase RsmD n=1 Tax=Aestuariibacter salexigens TaxID=226010 RepID=UPI000479D7F4|nr:16S rRNA (guanine(966)-N(2))-methyltransferase RsmD [Aestuariibacter salexigens]
MKRGTKKPTGASGSFRIISGQWRGRKLPVADLPGLRPTTDRTRETLFNWLMQDVRGARCLDLFAGAGSLGFECLSRGAQHVTFVDTNRVACAQLHDNLKTLRVDKQFATVIEGDALSQLNTMQDSVDLVFIDPPFHQQLCQPCIEQLAQSSILAPEALVYVEHEAQLNSLATPAHWHLLKQKRTQQVSYQLYLVNRNDT